jgi:hypothetical protein
MVIDYRRNTLYFYCKTDFFASIFVLFALELLEKDNDLVFVPMHIILSMLPYIHLLLLPYTQPQSMIQGLNNMDFLNPPYAFAATYTISGQVSAEGGQTQFGDGNILILLSGPKSGSALTGGTGGTFTFSALPAGTYLVHIDLPAGYKALTAVTVSTTVGPSKVVNFSVSYVAPTSTPAPTPTTKPAPTPTTKPAPTATPPPAATATPTNIPVATAIPTQTPIPTAIPTPTVTPTPTPAVFTVSGNVFDDSNKDGIEDNGESNYPVAPGINTSEGNVTANTNGSYTINNILAGAVSVSYTSLPTAYYMTSPLNGPPPTFSVTVGTGGCSVNGKPGATCTNGNITNLNFGITNTYPWIQSSCGDIRNDNGFTDTLPAGNSALLTTGSCTNPGLVFTGDIDANFGSGQASTTNQVVGSITYPEVYPSNNIPLYTNYSSLLAKAQSAEITPTDLSTECTLSDCTLPATLAHGIYQANGNLTLNAYTFPANENYVILVNGELTINGSISVPVGSTVLFSTSGNITISPTVGSAATVTTSSLDGWYVAGGSFIFPTAGNCTDLRLNIAGSVAVDALGTGGSFQNNRDLCGSDAIDPTVSFLQRLDMILNAPQFINEQQSISQEIAP